MKGIWQGKPHLDDLEKQAINSKMLVTHRCGELSPPPPFVFLHQLSTMMGDMPASLQESYLHTALTRLATATSTDSHPALCILQGQPTEGDVTAKATTVGPNPASLCGKLK